MIKIQILSESVDERGGTIQRGDRKGETYHIRNQEGYVHNGHAFPERFQIALGERPAYPVGMYYLDPATVQVGDYDKIEIGRSLLLLTEDQAAAYLREQLPASLLAKVTESSVKPVKSAQAA
ncbi:hypothetical protein A7A76_08510 [Lysobacter enzymogenes]|uniref:single-stranded DNA-binding protein n=1 Tax=Lysobacter enzymogenes TaxID=69 RepID=UPI0019D047FA|nr:single-stranded DNA-binding protein [Lysobacter enzymogenes]MBN7134760.1 hypothetical protein [Lysobacter enzymogenes]